jgi:tetratricopeptide (TPR) repeat protein
MQWPAILGINDSMCITGGSVMIQAPLIKIAASLALIWSLSACVNLSAVRDFSAEAGPTVARTDAAALWAGAADRLAQLPNQPQERIEKLRTQRAQVFAEISKVHVLLADYYRVVTALAADDLVKVDVPVQNLANGLADLDAAFDANDKQAFIGLANLLRLPLDMYRHRKIGEFLGQTREPVDSLLTGLIRLNSIYQQSLQGEMEIATAPYHRYLDDPAASPATRLLLTRTLGQVKAEYEQYLAALRTYGKAIALVRDRQDAMMTASSDKGESLTNAVRQLKDAQAALREAGLALRLATGR